MFVRIDRRGIRQVLLSNEMKSAINSLAKRLATATESNSAIRDHEADVVVENYVTDRAASAVTIQSPIGKGLNAKYGVFNQAASSLGGQIVSK
jgi:CRP-like cAMP-binding protein